MLELKPVHELRTLYSTSESHIFVLNSDENDLESKLNCLGFRSVFLPAITVPLKRDGSSVSMVPPGGRATGTCPSVSLRRGEVIPGEEPERKDGMIVGTEVKVVSRRLGTRTRMRV